MAILLTRIHEVPTAALKSEAVWKILEALHDIHNGAINLMRIQRGQGFLPLLKIMRVVYEALWFCECLQLPFPFLNATAQAYASFNRRLHPASWRVSSSVGYDLQAHHVVRDFEVIELALGKKGLDFGRDMKTSFL